MSNIYESLSKSRKKAVEYAMAMSSLDEQMRKELNEAENEYRKKLQELNDKYYTNVDSIHTKFSPKFDTLMKTYVNEASLFKIGDKVLIKRYGERKRIVQITDVWTTGRDGIIRYEFLNDETGKADGFCESDIIKYLV